MEIFLDNEVKKAKRLKRIHGDDISLYDKTIEQISSIKNDLFKCKDGSYETIFLNNLFNIKIDDNLFNFIMTIVNEYANIPLLEIESSIEYPVLSKMNISDNYLLYYPNKILKEQGITELFLSRENFKIFEISTFNRLKMYERAILYNRYYTNESFILLNKYYSVIDLIEPIKTTILLLNYNNYNNSSHILRYFIEHKALNYLIDNNNIDSINYNHIIIDNLVRKARQIKRVCQNIDRTHLDKTAIKNIIDFIDHVLGLELSRLDITYEELSTLLNNSNTISLKNLPISESSIIEKANNYTEKILKKQYYR